MPQTAVAGAVLTCSFGTAPATLNVLPTGVIIEDRPAATITATAMGVNIPPFAMCTSLANPAVAAATSAALGVLTPMPCTPAVVGTWIPQVPNVLVGGEPVLTMGAQCMCAYAGLIAMTFPGAMRTVAG
jgi:hypothetical protein